MSGALEVIDHDTGELVPYEHTQTEVTLFGSLEPAAVVREATKHAKALTKVIEDRKLFTMIQGKKHIQVEAWQTLGAMTGVFAALEAGTEPEYVEIGGVAGFKATVVATRNGQVIGRATSFCMRDEPTWRGRNIYALAGMAQTRATSRALKGPLGFIVKLAGYEATPAEEMPPDFVPVGQEDLPVALQSDVPDRAPIVQELLLTADKLGARDATVAAVAKSLETRSPAADVRWLEEQLVKAKQKLAEQDAAAT